MANDPMPIGSAIEFNGFNRVVVTEEGEAVIPSRAIRDFNVGPDIGFRRDDGWTLGAPKELEEVAYNLWKDKWTHFINFGDSFYQPIELYKGV